MQTGLLHLRHISSNNTTFATAIPRKHTVYVYIHKYQDILAHDPGELSYPEYFKWLERNGYAEVSHRPHTATIKQEYDKIPRYEKTTPTEGLNERQTSLFDYI